MTGVNRKAAEKMLDVAEVVEATGLKWFSSPAFDVRKRIGRLEVGAKMRKRDGFMGRFGGGWNWMLGIQLGSTTLLIRLLVMTVSIRWLKKEVAP